MIIIGVDFHPEFQQMAWVDTDSGEFQERRLQHREEAATFYRALAGQKVCVGMEASGHARWFERLVAELQFELRIGDAAKIQTKRVRKQKTDRQDAQLILGLLLEDRFPQIWVPSWENRDLRQLLWHRHRMVQARTRIMNQLQVVALNEGWRCKKRLWRERGRQQPSVDACCSRRSPELEPQRTHGQIRILYVLQHTISSCARCSSGSPPSSPALFATWWLHLLDSMLRTCAQCAPPTHG